MQNNKKWEGSLSLPFSLSRNRANFDLSIVARRRPNESRCFDRAYSMNGGRSIVCSGKSFSFRCDCRARSALTAIESGRQDDEDEADDRRGSVRDHGRLNCRTMCSWLVLGGCLIVSQRPRPSHGRCSRRRRRRRRRRGKVWTACDCTRSPLAVVVVVVVPVVLVVVAAESRVAAGMRARSLAPSGIRVAHRVRHLTRTHSNRLTRVTRPSHRVSPRHSISARYAADPPPSNPPRCARRRAGAFVDGARAVFLSSSPPRHPRGGKGARTPAGAIAPPSLLSASTLLKIWIRFYAAP